MINRPSTRHALAAIAIAIAITSTAHGITADIQLFFSPRGGCADAAVKAIAAATTSMDIMAYSISEPRITAAIKEAKARGIKCRMVVNPTQESPVESSANAIAQSGVETRTDTIERLMHTKAIIIDAKIVICGSFNFSTAAENENAEAMMIVTDETIAKRYTEHFNEHWNHSRPFTKRPVHRHNSNVPPAPLPIPTTPPTKKDDVSWHVLKDLCIPTKRPARFKAA